jgi:cytoskeletal protein RodZ
MSNRLEVEAEEEEPKIEDVEIEGEGIPRTFGRSKDYLKGYKAGWLTAKKNVLKKLSESGEPIEKKSIEEKPIGKKKSKKEEGEVSLLTWAIVGLVLGGITLFVLFNESNRKRNQSAGQ